eukprot:CAMPEP_0198689078 /NCGR_PEP_ID=MMETSP1468-20131203/128381_1 /TAXON_ID=1461545 /ORGANISM="Mantoniella sp, Strain CCMP1436" /LENGTH=34 /DNA_ID= /DNA_START= /DNA_END= /DNA_ORIENTATION=
MDLQSPGYTRSLPLRCCRALQLAVPDGISGLRFT